MSISDPYFGSYYFVEKWLSLNKDFAFEKGNFTVLEKSFNEKFSLNGGDMRCYLDALALDQKIHRTNKKLIDSNWAARQTTLAPFKQKFNRAFNHPEFKTLRSDFNQLKQEHKKLKRIKTEQSDLEKNFLKEKGVILYFLCALIIGIRCWF